MKTIVSLALVGLMSISTLLPALAAQETENVSIPVSSGEMLRFTWSTAVSTPLPP